MCWLPCEMANESSSIFTVDFEEVVAFRVCASTLFVYHILIKLSNLSGYSKRFRKNFELFFWFDSIFLHICLSDSCKLGYFHQYSRTKMKKIENILRYPIVIKLPEEQQMPKGIHSKNQQPFIQMSMGSGFFPQILGELRRCMSEMLKF